MNEGVWRDCFFQIAATMRAFTTTATGDMIAYAAQVVKVTTHKETSNIFIEANRSLIVTATHSYSHDRSVSFTFCPIEKDPTVVLKVPRYYGYNSQDLPPEQSNNRGVERNQVAATDMLQSVARTE